MWFSPPHNAVSVLTKSVKGNCIERKRYWVAYWHTELSARRECATRLAKTANQIEEVQSGEEQHNIVTRRITRDFTFHWFCQLYLSNQHSLVNDLKTRVLTPRRADSWDYNYVGWWRYCKRWRVVPQIYTLHANKRKKWFTKYRHAWATTGIVSTWRHG